ncbi:hypothetical protein [Elioraea thermophila]|uniref:hypothetical protein n=1 Tax=Elioraea thermophila TaxID=2185104 RepID=UPI000DF34256|nr:hypothetical protein [Elioraea thermophila]
MTFVHRPLAETLAATLLGAPYRLPQRTTVIHGATASPAQDDAATCASAAEPGSASASRTEPKAEPTAAR